MVHTVQARIGANDLIIETGRVARQAAGAVTVRYGDTVVLATAAAASTPRPDTDFLPLAVDYRESFYAAGRIPGGFFKREGRPNEREILTCRLIDRPLRPLFPDNWRAETQLTCLLLSADRENDSDVLAITGAATALAISDLPFEKPVAAVRVGLVNDEFVVFPTVQELAESRLNLVVAGSRDAIVMVEAGAQELPEDRIVEALGFAHEHIRSIVDLQEQLVGLVQPTKRSAPPKESDAALEEEIRENFGERLSEAMRTPGKLAASSAAAAVKADIRAHVAGRGEDGATAQVGDIVKSLEEQILRRAVLEEGRRLDGRSFDEIREITCDVSVLPRAHGSSIFTRGETQALAVTTLAPTSEAQRLDWVHGGGEKRFMLHYNFPAFSVGEARMMRGPGRREIGHGALAERALLPVIPDEESFNYAIRVVSDTLESNGSSSMAAVTGGCLSLMDAGVPLRAAIAGVAMGLVTDGTKHCILTDIAGAEDHFGDMDFKVAGTGSGITALQMDIKISGLSLDLVSEALQKAKEARESILAKMAETLPAPREETSEHAPSILTMKIPVRKIRDVIGAGGKTIRAITDETGARVDVGDDGVIQIAGIDAATARRAMEWIDGIANGPVPEMGRDYNGVVKTIVDFGAFVEILPGTDGLLHISEIADHHVHSVRDELQEGDEVEVRVIEMDQSGKVRLSTKEILRERAGLPPSAPRGPRRRPGGGGPPRRRERGDREHRGRGGDREHRDRGGDRDYRDRGGDRPYRDRGGDRPYRDRGGDRDYRDRRDR